MDVVGRLPMAVGMVALAACAAEIDRPSEGFQAEAVISGTEHRGDPMVVAVLARRANLHLCTGTVIAPRVVLTARHCVEEWGTGARDPVAALSIARTEPDGTHTRLSDVAEVITTEGAMVLGGGTPDPQRYPSLEGFDFFEAPNDIALLVLPGAVAGEPVPIRRSDPGLAPGREVDVIGYGQNVRGGTAPSIKRRGTARIALVSAEAFVMDQGNLPCHGDSGGPMMLDGALVGVFSSEVTVDGVECVLSSALRISAFLSLVDRALARAGTSAAPAPSPATPLAPPSGAPKSTDPTSDAPTYGTVRIAPGFAPASARAEGISGGDVRASTHGPDCVGMIARPPDHVLELEGDFPYLRIIVQGGSGDPTLIVETPEGDVVCADDSDGLQPIIGGRATRGAYRVWVGEYRGLGAPYAIGWSERRDATTRDVTPPR